MNTDDNEPAEDGTPASEPTTLAALLNRLRREAGLSLYELAKRSGINRSTLMRIESGETTSPDSETLNALARTFEIEPELFYDAVWRHTTEPLPSPALYFRSKYRLNDAQIAELEASLKRVTGTGDDKKPNKQDERRSP